MLDYTLSVVVNGQAVQSGGFEAYFRMDTGKLVLNLTPGHEYVEAKEPTPPNLEALEEEEKEERDMLSHDKILDIINKKKQDGQDRI